MKHGKELDALVQERVMGAVWKASKRVPEQSPVLEIGVWLFPDGSSRSDLPAYSTEIAAAWEVLAALESNDWHWYINPYEVSLNHSDGRYVEISDEVDSTAGRICLAALKATGWKEVR